MISLLIVFVISVTSFNKANFQKAFVVKDFGAIGDGKTGDAIAI